jgi:predicted Zn-dependent peptidase
VSKVNKTTLKNGIRILSKRMPHVRSVSMGVWVNAGARDETPAQNGLSHLIEHMIFKGTDKRSAYEIAKQFDAIGGQTNAFTTMETTCYHARVMDTQLETMADILTDIFLNSVFDESEVERERPVILQEIGMVEDSPEDYVHLLSGGTFWGEHSLGRSILGTRENVMGFDAETIKGFFHRFYQPERIVISAAGNVDHQQILDLVAPAFEQVPAGNGFPERICPVTGSEICLHQRQLEQAHVCVLTPGLPVTDPRRYAFSLMNSILGGNMSSRLFQEIRERRGLAYSIYSFVSSHVDTGMFGVYVGVEPARVRETTTLILQQLRKIKEAVVEEAELRDAKEFTKGSLFLSSESSDNQMARLAQNELHFGRTFSLDEVVAGIESVSVEDIRELAGALFNRDRLALTLLSPVAEKSAFEGLGQALGN